MADSSSTSNQKRYPAVKPLVTGQRILDTLFPIAKAVRRNSGWIWYRKTMTQHQIAKWSDADIIIYIGCGERGNEMTQVLEDFSKPIDPKSGRPLMDRTTLIANTSNMPVARVKQVFTPESHLQNIIVIWGIMLRLWRILPLDGQKHFVNYPDDWKKCLPKRASCLPCKQAFCILRACRLCTESEYYGRLGIYNRCCFSTGW